MPGRAPFPGAGTLEFIDAFIGHCARTGFTPQEAAAWADELTALASPWHLPPDTAKPPWWLWHRHFSRRARAACTPELWRAYRTAWTDSLTHRLFREPFLCIADESTFAREVWPHLALNEDAAGWYRRRGGTWSVPDVTSWPALAARLHARKIVPELVRVPSLVCSWSQMWKSTGLRALRWGWVDAHDASWLDRLPGVLVAVQEKLAAPLAWEGPVLGLAGSTTLALTASEHHHGCGRVTRDADGQGQNLEVDDWSVLAHEWLHTLDLVLAKGSGGKSGWATLTLVEDDPAIPADPAHAAALDAWWVQVIRIQMSPLPAAVAQEAHAELLRWPERWEVALDRIPGAPGRIADERAYTQGSDWNEGASALRWQQWLDDRLPDAPASLRDRLARTAAAEIAWGRSDHVPEDDRPLWARFLTVAVPDRSTLPALARTDTTAYLAHPVEIMARSFEVAFARPDDPVWGAPRSPAGMIWPLPAETRHQREGWQECFAEIRPWWDALWRDRMPRQAFRSIASG